MDGAGGEGEVGSAVVGMTRGVAVAATVGTAATGMLVGAEVAWGVVVGPNVGNGALGVAGGTAGGCRLQARMASSAATSATAKGRITETFSFVTHHSFLDLTDILPKGMLRVSRRLLISLMLINITHLYPINVLFVNKWRPGHGHGLIVSRVAATRRFIKNSAC